MKRHKVKTNGMATIQKCQKSQKRKERRKEGRKEGKKKGKGLILVNKLGASHINLFIPTGKLNFIYLFIPGIVSSQQI